MYTGSGTKTGKESKPQSKTWLFSSTQQNTLLICGLNLDCIHQQSLSDKTDFGRFWDTHLPFPRTLQG